MAEEPPELAAFCRAQWPRLVGSLTLQTGNRDLAADLAQETLARVCRDWHKVRDLDAPGAWVHRVAVNLAHSHFRRRRVSLSARRRVGSGANEAASEADAVNAIVVRAAVAALPTRQRTALVLRYYADLSVAQVAEVMGCPEGTVKTLTSRAIAALRAQGLAEEDSKEDTDAHRPA